SPASTPLPYTTLFRSPSTGHPMRNRAMSGVEEGLRGEAARAASLLTRVAQTRVPALTLREVGTVRSVARGTARIAGLSGVASERSEEHTSELQSRGKL